MILLDTNVISELIGPAPAAEVVEWLDQQSASSIWTTTVTLYEIRAGILSAPAGRRRFELESRFDRWLATGLGGRILEFGPAAAEQAASLYADRKHRGRPIDARDTMIAGIVLANRATLATRNTRHFEELRPRLVNPWEAESKACS